MKKYLFIIRLTGFGNNPDDAWRDAIESTNLDEDDTPEKDDIIELSEEEAE
jgi:hypothetical protein